VLAAALSWPLIARIAAWVPGIPQWAFDESTFVWNTWYLKHALIDNLSSPLHTDLVYYPLGVDLILYTYNFFHALVSQPLHLAVNLVVASNVTLLLSTVLSGYGAFLLVRYLLATDPQSGPGTQGADGRMDGRVRPSSTAWARSAFPAVLAGLLFAFASNRAIYASLGHYDMVTTQWIPFYALMLLRSLDGRLSSRVRRRSAALAGLFFAFNGLAEMILAVFLAIFTIIVAVVKLGEARRDQDAAALIPRSGIQFVIRRVGTMFAAFSIIGIVAFIAWSPVLVPILRQFLTNDFSLKGWGEAIPLSTDLLGWFTPTVLHPFFGGDLVAELRRVQLRAISEAIGGFRDVNTAYIGWMSAGLAVLGVLAYGKRVRIWGWTALIFALFTLGPFLQINGQYRFNLDGIETSYPLPFALLHYIPIVKANRAPNRNSVLLMLGIAVLAGYGIHWLLAKIHSQREPREHPNNRSRTVFAGAVTLLFGLAVLFEHLAVPLPLSDARIPAVYQEIAADPRPVSVMQLPLGWRNSFGTFGPERTQLQYYQVAHGKPLIGGNISRAPDFKMDYFRRIPLFQALTNVEFGKAVAPELDAAARQQADELVYLYNIGYVLLFPPIPERYPYVDNWQAAWAFAKDVLPLEDEPFWTKDGIEAYRTVQPEGSDAFSVALGEPGTFPYRAEGWDAAETDRIYDLPAIWATEAESCLFLPLRQVDINADYTLRTQIHPFAYPGGPTQQVSMTINHTMVGSQALSGDWQTLTWVAPGSTLQNSINRICFQWAHLAVPREVAGGSRMIGQTGVTLPVDVDLKSFADGGFMALFDEEGNQSDGSAGRRGVNVTVLQPQTGEIVAKEGFDTAANEFESARLADFLAQAPDGAPVLVVSKGDAWRHLTPAAVDGLRRLGADLSLDGLQGQYFAIVGVKGAAPGTAAMAMDNTEAFLRVSLNRDRRTLAAAVGQVIIER
jgi:hypothetical protein